MHYPGSLLKSTNCYRLDGVPVNTFLSAKQQTLLEEYQVYARDELKPLMAKSSKQDIPLQAVLSKLAQDRFLGLNVPLEYGGSGLGLLDLVLFSQAVGQYDRGLGITLAAHAAVVESIKK